MSDAFWIALFGSMAVLVPAGMQFLTQRALAKAAVKVEEVRTTLVKADAERDEQLEEIAKVGHDTHTLVNNNFGVQLHMHMIVTQRMADLTNLPEDISAAALAKDVYEEHMRKQGIVDAEKVSRGGG